MPSGCRWAALSAMCACVCVAVPAARDAHAQGRDGASGAELAAARALFAEALRDEEAARFEDALQKLRRVRDVRDTAAVEYRMGTCYEGLTRDVPAFASYRRSATLASTDAQNAEVLEAARDRLRALAKRVALLALDLSDTASADAEVRVDGAVVSRDERSEGIVLEPGVHVITATSGDASPYRREMTLHEGARDTVTIALVARARERVAPLPVDGGTEPSARSPDDAKRTAGWIGIAAGGTLLASCAAVLLVRSGEVSKLAHTCPGSVCPPGADRGDLESTRDRAAVEGPVGIALGTAGVLALGTGAYLLILAGARSVAHAAPTRVLPLAGTSVLGVAFAGELR